MARDISPCCMDPNVVCYTTVVEVGKNGAGMLIRRKQAVVEETSSLKEEYAGLLKDQLPQLPPLRPRPRREKVANVIMAKPVRLERQMRAFDCCGSVV